MKQFFTFCLIAFVTFTALNAQNNSLRFDPLDDYVQIDEFAVSGAFTVECQFRAGINSQVPFEERIISIGATNRLELGLEGTGAATRLWLFDQNNSEVSLLADTNPRDGEWHHFAITQAGNLAVVYFDGEPLMEYNITPDDTAYGPNMRIGAWTGGLSTRTFYHGEVDEVRVWEGARTAEEIASAFDCQISGQEDGLIAYYNFNQGEAGGDNDQETILIDRTGNGFDGELRNFFLQGTLSNWIDSGNPDTFCDFVSSTGELRPELWSVYPNPTTDRVWVTGTTAETSILDVYNQQGVRLQQLQLRGTETVDLSAYPVGMYMLVLSQASGRAVYKVVKQ